MDTRHGSVADSGGGWQVCNELPARCAMETLADRAGKEIVVGLLRFIARSSPGSRLTLQRNRGEFTLQVTGAVQHSSGRPLGPEDLKELEVLLSSPEGGTEPA